MPAARRAVDRGLVTALGAPNLVRGGSPWGNLDVASAIDAGIVDVLCSDYHPSSLLAAAVVETGEPMADRIRRITTNPADAVGLEDRGRLAAGCRADVIVVDPARVPTVADCSPPAARSPALVALATNRNPPTLGETGWGTVSGGGHVLRRWVVGVRCRVTLLSGG